MLSPGPLTDSVLLHPLEREKRRKRNGEEERRGEEKRGEERGEERRGEERRGEEYRTEAVAVATHADRIFNEHANK